MSRFPALPSHEEIREVVERVYGPTTGRVTGLAFGGRPSSVAGSTAMVGRLSQVQFDSKRVIGTRLICKVIHHGAAHERWPASADPADPMYWKREALVYGSGMLETLGPLRAPRCYGIFERDDGTVAIWLEDARGAIPQGWSIDRYALAARHLGLAQARFLTGLPLPDEPWLASGWLDAYVARRESQIVYLDDDELWAHPLARRYLGTLDADLWRSVWTDRSRYLAALRALPQTLTHNDFWPRNLFGALDGSTIAIDWAYLGIGAIGEDLGNLIGTALLDRFVPAAQADWFLRAVLRGYLTGAREAGHRPPVGQVRFAIAATLALKFCWMLGHMLRLTTDREGLIAIEESTVDEPWGRMDDFVSLLDTLGGWTGGRYDVSRRVGRRIAPATDPDADLDRLPNLSRFYAARAEAIRFLEGQARLAGSLLDRR